MPKISALSELTAPDGDDELAIVDTSSTETRKIKASTLFGIGTGWASAPETPTYSTYDSNTRIAEMVVSAGADAVYTAGMRIKFSQPTDGVKYGIIVMVESELLHVFMNSDYDFDNEALTDVFVSRVKVPQGFDLDPEKWEVLLYDTTDSTIQASMTGGVYYTTGFSIDIGVGAWSVYFCGNVLSDRTAGGTGANNRIVLSTTTNSLTDRRFVISGVQRFVAATTTEQYKPSAAYAVTVPLNLTSPDTYYVLVQAGQTGTNLKVSHSSYNPLVVRATCAYL